MDSKDVNGRQHPPRPDAAETAAFILDMVKAMMVMAAGHVELGEVSYHLEMVYLVTAEISMRNGHLRPNSGSPAAPDV